METTTEIVDGMIKTTVTQVTVTTTSREDIVARMATRAANIETMKANIATRLAEQEADTDSLALF